MPVHFITVETITTLIHKPCLIMTGEILVKKPADGEVDIRGFMPQLDEDIFATDAAQGIMKPTTEF